MTSRRLFIHSVFVLLLPIIVAWNGLSVATAVALVLLMLAWRWMITLSGIIAPEKVPELELETIAASHFVEKVRWCMDRLGVDYVERQAVGVLGVFFIGRSVPRLQFRTGMVRSSIGNSAEILRYLWGQYSAVKGDKADFLEPTKERLALEKRLDRYGVDLQVWIYYHILGDRQLTQYVWGCSSPVIPAWQRYAVMAIYPVLRALIRKAFQINDAHYTKSVQHVESILSELDGILADGRASILGGDSIDYVDITFASISGLWLQPPEFGRDKADQIRVERQQLPSAMNADCERWMTNYPHATEFMRRLYQQERFCS